MKKALAALAASIVTAATAAGPYDGIYQSTANPNQYLSVHQNGSAIIAASFSTLPSFNINFYVGGYQFTPQRADVWDLYSGTINGNTAIIQGENIFGACLEAGTATFDATGLNYRISASTQTPAGRAQGFPCVAAPNSQLRFNRVF